MRKEKFYQIIDELKIMFSDLNHLGTVKVDEGETRALVEIRTKDMILETHKENIYFHGALMNCDNYSLKAENGELVIVFGFEWQ